MDSRYIDGIASDNGWITWKSLQGVFSPEYFIHSTYFLQGNPADATLATIAKILKDKDVFRRSNLRNHLNKVGFTDWKNVATYVNTELPYGSSFYTGAHPVIIWQNPLNGKWMMATGYGISIGFEVCIKKSFDWRLRKKPLIGWIYFMGPGYRANYRKGITKMLKNKEIIIPWYSVHLDVWGQMGDNGLEMGNVKWQPLIGMKGAMTIGGISVIRSPPPSNIISGEWQDWAVNELNDGKGLIYNIRANGAKEGKYITVFQRGTKTEEISPEDYERINKEITVNIVHDKHGRILHKRQ